jgi:hypothetical protein
MEGHLGSFICKQCITACINYLHTARGTKFLEHSASLNILLRSAVVVVRPVLADSLCEATSVAVWITAQGLISGV